MELLSQPFNGQLGDRLIEAIASEEFQTLNVCVAFAKNSGVLRLKGAITRFRERGGIVNVYVGVDLGGTSYEALCNLRANVDALWVIHSDRGQTFHTKIYNFVGDDKALVIVGSNNLTGGGLWTNFESAVISGVSLNSAEGLDLQHQVDEFLSDLESLGSASMPITTQADIEKLLEYGYIEKEVAQRIRTRNDPRPPRTTSGLFGAVVQARLPRVVVESSTSPPQASIQSLRDSFNEQEPVIWFETGKMTGGSRNILDLSMKSLVERGDPRGTPFEHMEQGFMRGGVEFFGIDPMDTTVRKDVTINFDGADYSGNTILFPEGASANGTWRLQIKGTDATGRKITEAFRSTGEEYFLVRKVAVFTRIPGDYFYLTVFPESDLPEFETASKILARNGSSLNARRLGLL